MAKFTNADASFCPVEAIRVDAASREAIHDQVAIEEPLEVRLHGRPFAVIMRTPGADRELAAGFLFAERVIRSGDDLGNIQYCQDAQEEARGNIVDVTLSSDAQARLEQIFAERRNVTTNSSCGMCGRLSIESVTVDLPAIPIRERTA